MEYIPTANMEGGLSAITDTTALENQKSFSQPEQILPNQPVVVSPPPSWPQAPQNPRSPLFFERSLDDHPSNLEDAEDADLPHRSRSWSSSQLHTQALRLPPAARQYGISQEQQAQQTPGSKHLEEVRPLAKGPGKSREGQAFNLNDTGTANSVYANPQQAPGAL